MPTETVRQHRKMLATIAKEMEGRGRAKVRELTGKLREARTSRAQAMRDIAMFSSQERIKIKFARTRALATLRARFRHRLEELRSNTKARRDKVASNITSIRAERDKLRLEENQLSRAGRSGRAAARNRPKVLAKERAGQSDYEVEGNISAIDPMLVPLWRKSRRTFTGTSHERLEAFMQYAHDHHEEVVADQFDEAERAAERMIEEHQRKMAREVA